MALDFSFFIENGSGDLVSLVVDFLGAKVVSEGDVTTTHSFGSVNSLISCIENEEIDYGELMPEFVSNLSLLLSFDKNSQEDHMLVVNKLFDEVMKNTNSKIAVFFNSDLMIYFDSEVGRVNRFE